MEGPRGDLETESGRIRSELPHEPERIVDKGSVNELGTGHVDGDADPQTVPAPLGGLADGLVHDPAPQGVELARFFRDPDELGRVDQSATAPPAKEGLDAPALAASEVDDRLVLKDELVLLQCVLEIVRGEWLLRRSPIGPAPGEVRAGELLDHARSR